MIGDVINEQFSPLEPQDVDLIFLKAKTSSIDKSSAVIKSDFLLTLR